MEPYQMRVMEEKRDLDERLTRLGEYLLNPAHKSLRIAERNLLHEQQRIMQDYSRVLGERIALFRSQDQPTEIAA